MTTPEGFVPFSDDMLESSLAAHLERQARTRPAALAVVGAGQQYSYAQFNHLASHVARQIRHCIAASPVRCQIAVMLPHDAPVLAAAFGVFKAGQTCVVLDASDPDSRLEWLLADSDAAAIVSDEAGASRARLLAGPRPVIVFDPSALPEVVVDDACVVEPASPAMILYTSGSTGRPKGVVRSHRALIQASANALDVFGVCGTDRLSMFSRFSTGQGVTAPLTAVLCGASVHLFALKERGLAPLGAWLDEQRISVFQSSTTVFGYLGRTLPATARLEHLRVVRLGGEPLAQETLDVASRHLTSTCRVFNVFSMTETGSVLYQPIDSSLRLVPGRTPIGFPMPGRAVAIMENGRVLPAGETGEICVRSRYLSDGYWRAPELTAERFIAQPDGATLLRTGDLGQQRPDGGIDHLGRLDLRVKIRGTRIEIEEVQAALASHPDVMSSAVVIGTDDPGASSLVAFYACRAESHVTAADLREHLRAALPDQMVPSRFVLLDEMPLTASGKIDRRQLETRAMDEPAMPSAARVLSSTEQRLARHFAEAAGRSAFDADTDFFIAGGDSLRAAQVLTRVRDEFGIDVPFRTFLVDSTIARLARRIDEYVRDVPRVDMSPILRRDATGPAPLSFSQQQLWLSDRLSPGQSAYNMPRAVRLTGEVDEDRLRAALNALVARHAALRTTFSLEGDEPVQVVAPARDIPFDFVDLSAIDDADRDAELDRRLHDAARRPFDLSRDVLIRAVLFRLGAADHALLLVNHHIATDARSSAILRHELAALYRGIDPATLPALDVEYADFSAWQRHEWSGTLIDRDLEYWTRRLAGAPEQLRLPTDRVRTSASKGVAGRQSIAWPEALVARLEALARAEQVTLFMLTMAAWQVLLHRYTGADDIVVGSPVSGRVRPEVEPVVGCFANIVVFRTSLAGDPSFLDVIRRVKDVALDAYDHQALPFDRLVEALRPVRAAGQNPLAQVCFGLYTFDGSAFGLPGLEARPIELTVGSAKFDLTLSASRRSNGIEGYVEYNADLLDAATVARMMTHFEILLDGLSTGPDRPISLLPLLSADEQRRAVVEWNDTTVAFPDDADLSELLRRATARCPDASAIAWTGGGWSYRDLERRADDVARRLIEAGMRAGERVGILMPRSPEFVVAVCGVVAAGGVYVPLDPLHPRARTAHVIHDAAIRIVVVSRSDAEVHAGLVVLVVDANGGVDGMAADADAPVHARPSAAGARGGDAVCVLYTSGSTGTPRGVEVTHRAVARLVLNAAYARISPADVVALLSNVAFDASTFEMWGALLNGARLAVLSPLAALAPRAFGEELRDSCVTVLFVPTALFHRIAEDAPATFAGVRQVFVGGEAMEPSAARRVRQAMAGRLVNVYGPTETTTFATFHAIDSVPEGTRALPIGRPISNTDVYVLDRRMAVVPVGVVGEICIGGPGLARGYLGTPELTDARFVAHPFREGHRIYRTGDLGYYRADGELMFAGRGDEQIKIRGFRVEPAEIDAVLGRHPLVAQSFVVATLDGMRERRLVAYVVPAADAALRDRAGAALSEDDLRVFVARHVPDFMVPSAFVLLDALPLTTNGKVDRRALPQLQAHQSGEAWEAPVGAVEERVATIWRDVIGVDRIGRRDHFFEIGGHSLTAVQVIARIDRELGRSLPPHLLFAHPTLERFAVCVAQADVSVPDRRITRRSPRTDVAPPSSAQRNEWARRRMTPADTGWMTVRMFDVDGVIDVPALESSLTQLVRRHEVLRTALRQRSDGLVQQILPPYRVVVRCVDVRTEADPDAAVERELSAEVDAPFSFLAGPWLRASVLRLAADRARLLLALPHVAFDGWSLDVLYRDLATYYDAACRGDVAVLPEPALQYADYASWAADRSRYTGQLDYWRRQLAGSVASVAAGRSTGGFRGVMRQATRLRTLPFVARGPFGAVARGAERIARQWMTPRSASSGGASEARRERIELPAPLAIAVRETARLCGVTVFAVLLAALQLVLMRRSGTRDIVVATFTANRARPELQDLVGPINNTLAIRTVVDDAEQFRDLVRRVHATVVEAQAHADVPFADVSAAITPPGALPLEHRIPIVFQLLESLRLTPSLHGARLSNLRTVSRHRSPRMALTMVAEDGGISGTLNSDPAFFDARSTAVILRDVVEILTAATRSPASRVAVLTTAPANPASVS